MKSEDVISIQSSEDNEPNKEKKNSILNQLQH